MDKDKIIDQLILEMRNINKLNSELLEKFIKQKDNLISKEKINESLHREIENLKKEIRLLKSSLTAKNKEITRIKKQYNANNKRLESDFNKEQCPKNKKKYLGQKILNKIIKF